MKHFTKRLISAVLAAETAVFLFSACTVADPSAARSESQTAISSAPAREHKNPVSNAEFDIDGSILVSYKGSGGIVTIPDGITEIDAKAFENSSMSDVKIPESVTKIDNEAFSGCDRLTGITIPESVTQIGVGAFGECSSLQSVSLPDGIKKISGYAFEGCKKLTGINIPESVTEIDENAFSDCESLAEINIPKGVKEIGTGAFDGTAWLKNTKGDFATVNGMLVRYKGHINNVTIPSGITKICGGAFYQDDTLLGVKIPEGVTSIGDDAFTRCLQLDSVTLPKSLTSIGSGAFSDCFISDIKIPENVSYIGGGAFDGTMWLRNNKDDFVTVNGILIKYKGSKKNIAVPKGVTSICGEAFSGNTGLASVSLPDGITKIGNHAFEGCEKLKSINIPGSVTAIGEAAFSGCNVIQSMSIPQSVTQIGEKAFAGCTALSSIDLPVKLSKIEDGTFDYCENLTDINIPKSVKSIGSAFCNCGLESIDIPDGVTEIGDYGAFSSCAKLKSVRLPDSVVKLGRYPFIGCSSLEAINVSSGNKKYGSGGGVLYSKDKSQLLCCPGNREGTFTVPGVVTEIGSDAFHDCDKLTAVKLCGGINIIGDRAFFFCKKLTGIAIPESVTVIGYDVFSHCPDMLSITVGSGSSVYASEDGVLYSKDKSTLLLFPCGKGGTFTVPPTVKKIGTDAFDSCEKLTDVIISEGVTEIGNSAFSDCTMLKSISIPKNVTKISGTAIWPSDSDVKLTIKGHSGSEAEKYANNDGIKFEKLG